MKGVARVAALFVFIASACTGNDAALPKQTALSPDGAQHSTPSYSPDGKKITWWSPATDSSGMFQLWVGNADLSSPAKLPVKAFNPWVAIWSPDGTRIAATSSEFGPAHIVVVPVAGGAVKRVTQGDSFEYPSMWYPDGDRVSYFATTAGGSVGSLVVSVKTGLVTPLVPSETQVLLGSPSPDGSHVGYFVIDRGKVTVWVADSAGGNPRQLTTEGFESLAQFHEWSPDGKELLYESQRTGTTDLWVAPIDGGKPRQLTRDVRNDFAGVWSNDGKWVAFISDRGRQTDLWLVPAAGGTEQRITDTVIEEQVPLMWRPGTNELTFVSQLQKSALWAVDLADGKERRLTPDSVRISAFNTSPDGKQIVYVIGHGGGVQDLAVMPLAGGAPRVLVAGGGTVISPLWSPDGTKIEFTSDRGGSSDVWVIDAGGGAPRQLVNWPSSERYPVWNEDGSAVYFISDRDSKLGDVWKVPASGGEPARMTKTGTVNWLTSRAGVKDIFLTTFGTRAGQIEIARLRPDGRLEKVWDKTSAYMASVSPSGDSIAAGIEQPNGKVASMILPTVGGTGRLILNPKDRPGNWSNDGKWLLYDMFVGGASETAIMHIADGTTRRLTTTPENESDAEITSDSKTVIFRRSLTVKRINSVDLTKLMASQK